MNHELPHVLTSRFNDDTWIENENYRDKRNMDGCIYGSPLCLSPKIQINSLAYVIEMNNSCNLIEGVGVIRNYPNFKQPSWIYKNNNRNRYIYTGKYRMDRYELIKYDSELIDYIETFCFTGKSKLSRGYCRKTYAERVYSNPKQLVSWSNNRLFKRK